MAAFHDTFRDLTKHRNKILAVYDAYEVSRAGEKLGLTLVEAIELLGQVERVSVLFGKKSKLGKLIQAILRDLGTNRNALLGATSLIIFDRPHLLYMVDKDNTEDREEEEEESLQQDSEEEESILLCLEGDRSFYGIGEPLNYNKAAKAYTSAAMKGLPEAMYMPAFMHRCGHCISNDEAKYCHWLNRLIEKDYAPAMYDMGILMLDWPDVLLSQCPSIVQAVNTAVANSNTEAQKNLLSTTYEFANCNDKEIDDSGNNNIVEKLTAEEECSEGEEEETMAKMTEIPLILALPEALSSNEDTKYWQTIAELKKKAISQFLSASKLGHVESMTQLGLIYQDLGYYDHAREWYEEAVCKGNNAKAKNLLGNLFMVGNSGKSKLGRDYYFLQACSKAGPCGRV